nr:MAG TPA: hypothetical protein [Caudoviricetes sp.]
MHRASSELCVKQPSLLSDTRQSSRSSAAYSGT